MNVILKFRWINCCKQFFFLLENNLETPTSCAVQLKRYILMCVDVWCLVLIVLGVLMFFFSSIRTVQEILLLKSEMILCKYIKHQCIVFSECKKAYNFETLPVGMVFWFSLSSNQKCNGNCRNNHRCKYDRDLPGYKNFKR